MPLMKCCDCPRQIRRKQVWRASRCQECRAVALRKRQRDFREECRRKKLCINCGEKLSRKSIIYCDICLAYHAGYSAISMRNKRARSPDYRADERAKVKARMRAIRAKRRALGLNNRGKPYASAGRKLGGEKQRERWLSTQNL